MALGPLSAICEPSQALTPATSSTSANNESVSVLLLMMRLEDSVATFNLCLCWQSWLQQDLCVGVAPSSSEEAEEARVVSHAVHTLGSRQGPNAPVLRDHGGSVCCFGAITNGVFGGVRVKGLALLHVLFNRSVCDWREIEGNASSGLQPAIQTFHSQFRQVQVCRRSRGQVRG